MKITSFEIWPYKMSLSNPYTISYETISSTTNVFLKINTNIGITGFGCAAPDYEVTGETSNSVVKVFNNFFEPLLLGTDPFRYVYQLNKLDGFKGKNPSAVAMVDMALYDILSKKADLPLFKLLGGYRTKIKTSITVGILPLSETIESINEFIRMGFSIIKLKGGINVGEDIEKIGKIREKFGNEITIRFDANQGYSVEETLKFVEQTFRYKIELLEQPISKTQPEKLGDVTNKTSVIIMADESIMSLADSYRLARKKLVDTLNIKLMKVGGIDEAIKINAVAKAANLGVMVGCMDESALSIAAGLHFALSRPNIKYADLDGHFDLIDDPTSEAINYKNGYLYTSEKAGLGFTF